MSVDRRTSAPVSDADHRQFLNRYYGLTHRVYDATRRYYLFGRDQALSRLLEEPWDSLIEIGVGTGRNLAKLHRQRPAARYAGVDASDVMVRHAGRRCPWARVSQGFAESADLTEALGIRPERILVSYALSMMARPHEVLENARRALHPNGRLVVVDFGDFRGFPRPLAHAFHHGWLERFHVDPKMPIVLEDAGATLEFGPGRYYCIGEIRAAACGG